MYKNPDSILLHLFPSIMNQMLWSMQLELPDSPDVLKRMRANKIRDRSISLGRRESYATRCMSPPPLPFHSPPSFISSPPPSLIYLRVNLFPPFPITPLPALFPAHPPSPWIPLASPFPPILFSLSISLPFSFPFSFPLSLPPSFHSILPSSFLLPSLILYLHYHNDKGCPLL